MKRRFVVNPLLCAYSAFIALFMAVMAGVMLYLVRFLSMGIFLAAALLFGGAALRYGAVLTVSELGVERQVLGIRRKTLRWDEIGEIGIGGTKVLRDPNSKRVGTLYIYFSEKPLTEAERLDLLLRWPPRNQCYLLFSHERVTAVQMHWDKKIETYNVGDLTLGEGLKN